MKTTSLNLQDLSCGHCIKNVKKVLENIEGVELAEVELTSAKITGYVDPQVLIDAIIDAGYGASLAEENTLPKSELLLQASLATAEKTASLKSAVEIEPVLTENTMLLLHGMNCAACVRKVENALQAVPDVTKVQVNLAEQTALVWGNIEPSCLVYAVENAGYKAEIIKDEQSCREKQQTQSEHEIAQRKRQAIVALIAGFGLMSWGLLGGAMNVTADNRFYWLIIGVIIFVVMIFSGGHYYCNAIKSLRKLNTTMDTLVALGTGMAWLYSMFVVLMPEFFPSHARHLYFESSAMIIGLINAGKVLEAKAKQRSSKALDRLLNLAPKTVNWVTEEGDKVLPLDDVKIGMKLRLNTGSRVPVDGKIIEGAVWVDESMLTGEPFPLEKQKGDKLSAGTLINDGAVIFQVEQIGAQTRLANIIRLVRQAQSSKPKIGQLADSIASVFVPTVMLIALLAAMIWYIYKQDFSYSFVVFTTVLIIACPCALGLATPMSIIAGVGRAAEFGVLIRNADVLQKASSVDTIVLDKTGTLTKSQPKVTALFLFNGTTEQQALQYAASLEQHSNHPLGKAILDFAQSRQIELCSIEKFSTLSGLGLAGYMAEKQVLLGNQALLNQYQIETIQANADVEEQSKIGSTAILLAVEQQLAALFVIRDPLREDSREAVQHLLEQGYQVIMLTGDQESTAQTVAAEVGISTVIAGVLPEQKAAEIQKLQQSGRKVLMVGDGINDAPALAQADVGMAMGNGTDVAIETAEMTLMRPSIHTVVDALALSKGTLKNMKQNLFFAFVYNVLGIPIAAGMLYPWFGILLNPMFGGAAMAFSSITVATNANRLLRFVPKN